MAIPLCVRLLAFYRAAEITSTVVGPRNPSHVSIVSVSSSPAGKRESMSTAKSVTSSENALASHGRLMWMYVLKALFSFRSLEATRRPRLNSIDDKGFAVDLNELRAWRFLSSNTATSVLVLVILAPYLVASIAFTATSEMLLSGCPNGCFFTVEEANVLLAGAILAILPIILACVLVRNKADPFGILRENTFACIFGGIPAVVAICAGQNYPASNNFNPAQIQVAGVLIMCFFQSWYQVLLYYKYKHLLSTKNEYGNDEHFFERFGEVFLDTGLHDLFEKALIAEHGVESLRFYDAALRWKHDFADMPTRTAESRAKKIISLYVGDASLYPVNLAGNTMEALLALGAKNGPFQATTFNNAIAEVKDLMQRDSYMRFVYSPAYQNYMQSPRVKSTQTKAIQVGDQT